MPAPCASRRWWARSSPGAAILHVSGAFLESATQGEEHRRILEALRPRSFMAVPLSARARLLGIVAHDLRNPLNAIIMSAEILVDRSFSDVMRIQQAQMILRSAHRMERLIQDLLDVASIQACSPSRAFCLLTKSIAHIVSPPMRRC